MKIHAISTNTIFRVKSVREADGIVRAHMGIVRIPSTYLLFDESGKLAGRAYTHANGRICWEAIK